VGCVVGFASQQTKDDKDGEAMQTTPPPVTDAAQEQKSGEFVGSAWER